MADQQGLTDRGPNVEALVASAARWMQQALTGWAENDYPAVAMLAPIAMEHLGKAALWRRHPALLVPLASNAEESLHILAGGTSAELENPNLRTVSLELVMRRLKRYVNPFPLSEQTIKSIVDVRNGSVHVGRKNPSKSLLFDILSMSDALLDDLGLDRPTFYAEHEANVRLLLDQRQSEVEARVAAKSARARIHLSALRERLGSEGMFTETATRLEAEARFQLELTDWFGDWGDNIAIDQGCPVCTFNGRLLGILSADADPDWDFERIADGEYESYIAGVSWTLSFTPQIYWCNVCKLELHGPAELAAAAVPSAQYDLDQAELDDDFDIDEFARTFYGDPDSDGYRGD